MMMVMMMTITIMMMATTTMIMLCARQAATHGSLRIMARHEGLSRRRHEDMKMSAAERLPKTVCVRKAERFSGMMGGRKRPIAIVSAASFT